MDYQLSGKQRARIAKRNRQIKRRVTTVTIICLILVSIGLLGLNVNAAVDTDTNLNKYYCSVIVSANDSLWNYANTYSPDGEFQKYIDEVMRMNHMNNTDLIIGQSLILPYYA